MPVFRDSNNIPPVLPDGDYIFRVHAFEIGISQGTKTRGADVYALDLKIEPTESPVSERLIDHESCAWKIDCFLKSAGVKLAKNEPFEFRQDTAERNHVRWVNPLGLRGWCHLRQKTLPPRNDAEAAEIKAGTRKAMIVNEVAVFYTDKEKLPAAKIAEEDAPF